MPLAAWRSIARTEQHHRRPPPPSRSPAADVRVESPPSAAGRQLDALASWLVSTDSKLIGRSFIGTSALILIACTVIGFLLGAERIDGDNALLDAGRPDAALRRISGSGWSTA